MRPYDARLDAIEAALRGPEQAPIIVFVNVGEDSAAKIVEARRARGLPDDADVQVYVVRWQR